MYNNSPTQHSSCNSHLHIIYHKLIYIYNTRLAVVPPEAPKRLFVCLPVCPSVQGLDTRVLLPPLGNRRTACCSPGAGRSSSLTLKTLLLYFPFIHSLLIFNFTLLSSVYLTVHLYIYLSTEAAPSCHRQQRPI